MDPKIVTGIAFGVAGLSFITLGAYSIVSGDREAGLAGLLLTMMGAASLHLAAHALKQ